MVGNVLAIVCGHDWDRTDDFSFVIARSILLFCKLQGFIECYRDKHSVD